MLIIDGDYPMALAVRANRDLTLPIDEARNAPPVARGSLGWPDKEIMATLPEMRRGQVAAALVKVVVDMERPGAVIARRTAKRSVGLCPWTRTDGLLPHSSDDGRGAATPQQSTNCGRTWLSGLRRPNTKTCPSASSSEWRGPTPSYGRIRSTSGTSRASGLLASDTTVPADTLTERVQEPTAAFSAERRSCYGKWVRWE